MNLTEKDQENIREAMRRANPDNADDLMRKMQELDPGLYLRFATELNSLTGHR